MNEERDDSQAKSPTESRLAQLRLRPLSATLESRVATGLAEADRAHRGDRFLWSAIASGAIAACVIVGVLVTDSNARGPSRSSTLGNHSAHPGSSVTMLARADQRWGDELNLASNWSLP